MRRLVAGSVVGLALLSAPAAAAPVVRPGIARLEGRFAMTGTVTRAVHVHGEHVGQTVHRSWTFTSPCSSGPCRTVQLHRQRQSGADTLMLNRISAGYYEGNGKFFAPLRCARRTYRRGVSVPFTIQVHVTAAALSGGRVLATAIRAKYTNRSRRNHTRCVFIPGHDAARYTGVPATGLPAAPAGASGLSPAGS